MTEEMTPKQNEIINKLIEILEKPGKLRTDVERKYISKILQKNEFFDHHIDKMLDLYEILYNLAPEFGLEKVKQYSALINFGDVGDKFYIILEGKAWVYVPKSDKEIADEIQRRSNTKPTYNSNSLQTPAEIEKFLRQVDKSRQRQNSISSKQKKTIIADQPDDNDNDSIDELVGQNFKRSSQKKLSSMYVPRRSILEIENKLAVEKKVKTSLTALLLPILASSLPTEEEDEVPLRREPSIGENLNVSPQTKPTQGSGQKEQSFSFSRSLAETKQIQGRNSSRKDTSMRKTQKIRTLSQVNMIEEEDEDPKKSPRFQAYLNNTPSELIKIEDLALISTKKGRNMYLKNGVITFKMAVSLDSGKYIGEKALFQNSARTATVVAEQDMCLVSLKKDPFQKIFQIQQENTKSKMETISRVFKGMWPAELRKVMICFTECSFKINEHIYHEGDKADGFYIVKEGEVKLIQTVDFASSGVNTNLMSAPEMLKSHKKVPHTVAILGSHQIFGQDDLLDRAKHRRISVISSSFDTVLYHMNNESFKMYLSLHNHYLFLDTLRSVSKLAKDWRQKKQQKFNDIRIPTSITKAKINNVEQLSKKSALLSPPKLEVLKKENFVGTNNTVTIFPNKSEQLATPSEYFNDNSKGKRLETYSDQKQFTFPSLEYESSENLVPSQPAELKVTSQKNLRNSKQAHSRDERLPTQSYMNTTNETEMSMRSPLLISSLVTKKEIVFKRSNSAYGLPSSQFQADDRSIFQTLSERHVRAKPKFSEAVVDSNQIHSRSKSGTPPTKNDSKGKLGHKTFQSVSKLQLNMDSQHFNGKQGEIDLGKTEKNSTERQKLFSYLKNMTQKTNMKPEFNTIYNPITPTSSHLPHAFGQTFSSYESPNCSPRSERVTMRQSIKNLEKNKLKSKLKIKFISSKHNMFRREPDRPYITKERYKDPASSPSY